MLTGYILGGVVCGGSHAPLFIISAILLWLGGWLLYYSLAGKLGVIMFNGALIKGKSAKVVSTVFSVIILGAGAVTLLSAVFGWGCPHQ